MLLRGGNVLHMSGASRTGGYSKWTLVELGSVPANDAFLTAAARQRPTCPRLILLSHQYLLEWCLEHSNMDVDFVLCVQIVHEMRLTPRF